MSKRKSYKSLYLESEKLLYHSQDKLDKSLEELKRIESIINSTTSEFVSPRVMNNCWHKNINKNDSCVCDMVYEMFSLTKNKQVLQTIDNEE